MSNQFLSHASNGIELRALKEAAALGFKESPTPVAPASAVDELDKQDKADSPTQSAVVQPSESDRKLSFDLGVPQRQHQSTLLPTNQLKKVSLDSRQDSDMSASSKQTIASLPLLTNPTSTAAVDNDLNESSTEVEKLSKVDELKEASKLDHLDEVDDSDLPLPAASQKSDSQTSPSKSVNGSNELTQIACAVSQPLRTPRDIPNTRLGNA